MTERQALELLAEIKNDRRAVDGQMRKIGNGEWVVVLNKPRDWHLWTYDDWLRWQVAQ